MKRKYPKKSLYSALKRRANKRGLTGAKRASYVYGTVHKIEARKKRKG